MSAQTAAAQYGKLTRLARCWEANGINARSLENYGMFLSSYAESPNSRPAPAPHN